MQWHGWEQPKWEKSFKKAHPSPLLLENQAFIDHRPNGWSRPATTITPRHAQQQRWDLLVSSGWKPGDHPGLVFSFKLQQMQICASHFNLKNWLQSRLSLQSNHKPTGQGVSSDPLLLQTMSVQLPTNPKPFHSYLVNMQQPKLKEHIFLSCIYSQPQEKGWPNKGIRSPLALRNSVAHRRVME